MKITALVATLMLGGISCAYAQGGPAEDIGGGAGGGAPSMQDGGGAPGMQEGGAGTDTGMTNRSSQGEEKSGPGDRGEGTPDARSSEKSESGNGRSEERGSKARSAEEKSDTKRATKSDDGATKDAPDRSAKQKDTTDTSKKAAGDTRDQSDRKAGDTAGTKDTQRTAGDKASSDSAKSVELSGDKRTRVQTAFKGAGDVKRRTDVDISISVGARLPRDWDFVPVPIAVVEVVPEYRGYVFAYVEDEYVICDPDTYEVVAVLPAERGYAAGGGGTSKCSSQLSLDTDERELILQSVREGREVDIADLSIGRSVPDDVELLTFPDSVISEASELGSCRYFDAGDQIAIVDPDEDKIVLIIDKS